MPKAAVYTMKLDAELREEFMAAAEANHRPASHVVRELMREFVRREHAAFLHRKVDAARVAVVNGQGRSDEQVESDFAARRARIIDKA